MRWFFAFLCFSFATMDVAAAAKCARSSVNIRSGPGTSNSVVSRASSGDGFETVGPTTEANGYSWQQVKRCGGHTVVGWMALKDEWQSECTCPGGATTDTTNQQQPPPVVAAPHAGGAGRWPLHYDAPKRCTGGAAPGAVALGQVMKRHFPAIREAQIYNCRSVGGSGSLSEHAEGRGIDLMVPTDLRHQNVADILVLHAKDLGIQAVIYNKRVWGYGRWFWRAYSGPNPHIDHIHTGMHWDGARGLRTADAEAVLGGAPAPPPPPPPPPAGQQEPPQEQDTPSVAGCVRASSAVNVRSSPSSSGQVMLVAFKNEEFSELDRSGSYVHIQNARGTGYAFGTFIERCDREQNARSLSSDLPLDRAADAPVLLDDWALGLICGIAGTLVVVAVVIAVAAYRRRQHHANDESSWKTMEEPVAHDSQERITSPRAKSSGKSVASVPTSSPNVARRHAATNV